MRRPAIVTAVTEPALGEPSRRVALTVPGERGAIGIVRLFVGGLSARLGLGYETMDDLQLALESILLRSAPGREITVEARIEDDAVSILVGPFERDPLQADLSRPGSLEPERLLAALVAGVESSARDGGHWLRLDVRVPAGSGSA
jgi:hypothetical protein